MEEMNKEQQFWDWFKKNEGDYLDLFLQGQEEAQRRMVNLMMELKKYSEGLQYRIGGNPFATRRELLINAVKEDAAQSAAKKLVQAAPSFENWIVISQDDGIGRNFIMSYDGLQLDTGKIWFLPLLNDQNEPTNRVKIFIGDYDPTKANVYMEAIVFMLQSLVGEDIPRTFTIEEVAPMPAGAEKQNYYKLTELANWLRLLKSN